MKNVLNITLLLISSFVKGQDINFTQFYEIPLLRNPALAGTYRGDFRASSTFRSQWGSVTVPYLSQALGAEFKIGVSKNSDNYMSLGLQFTNDVAGDSKFAKTQMLPVLAFHKLLSTEKDMYLSLGFMGGPVQQRFDPTNLRFDDQFVNGAYSPTNPTRQTFSQTQLMYIDGTVGLAFSSNFGYNSKFYLGIAYFHFTEPKVAFIKENDIRLNKKIIVNAGLSIPINDYDNLIFYADYFRHGGNSQGQGGFIYKHDLVQQDEDEALSISAGGLLRWNDALIPLVKLDYYKLGIGLSYDINISKLYTTSQVRGGFELVLSYKFFNNSNNSSLNRMRCPVNF